MSTPEPTSLDTDIRVGLMLSLGGDYTQEQENDAVNRVQTLISQEVSKGIREALERILKRMDEGGIDNFTARHYIDEALKEAKDE